ncbi:MAG TPA: LLM class flavin-dependent oxidoreductase [Dehalococcoidia bacterium]|nr:LLM class flavin-dependent oxidoreductase [Dehalococcoidia bacterium]
MRIGVMLPVGPRSITQAVEAAVVAEQAGFSSAWLANVGIDALTVLALAGKETERIELGTAVVPT